MERVIARPNLGDKVFRRTLEDRARPYFTLEQYGRHLGYHKRRGVGFWVARFRIVGGSYRQHRLGIADDRQEADGETVLSYEQAKDSARLWFKTSPDRDRATKEEQRLINEDLHFCPVGNVFTIGHALRDYVEWKRLSARRTNFSVIVSLINFHIVPRLAAIPVKDFTVEHIQRFTREVLQTPPKRGNRPLGPPVAIEALDDDALRKRKKTVNTLLSILRSALRMAWENGRIESERTWLRLRRFTNVAEPQGLHLSRKECRSLLRHCRSDIRRFVLAALYTGCRAAELRQMRCSQVGRDGYGVLITPLKSRRARFVFLPDEGMAWFLSLIEGRNPSDHVFVNDHTGRRFGRYMHLFKAAVRLAGLPEDFNFHGLRHTYASQLVQAGTPLPVVAEQLGHASPVTVMRTYGHLSPQIGESEVRQRFASVDKKNLKVARKRRKALRRWRSSLHEGEWRTYAKINDRSSLSNIV